MKKEIIVFDVDGTLSDLTHRRHHLVTSPDNPKKDWVSFFSTMEQDTCHETIAWLARNFHAQGHTIIICSGRPAKSKGVDCREVTMEWLKANNIEFDALYMRAAGDYRPDDIVKVELLNRIRHDFGEPFLWFDDRDRVVNAIRSQGVRVLQVADGSF